MQTMMSALLLGCAVLAVGAGGQDSDRADTLRQEHRPVDERWLERLDTVDRTLLNEIVGYAAPKFTEDLRWFNTDRKTWNDYRGKVVVLQSWSVRQGPQRTIPARLSRQFAKSADDVVTLFVHTPDGADDGEKFIERLKVDAPMVVDPTGAFLDELGIYREPVNVVIDRHGAVRYAGLNTRGLNEAVAVLVAEKFDPDKRPSERAKEVKADDASNAKFPTFSSPVSGARDVRGQKAPDFYIAEWISQPANPRGKVLIVEFSATWCGPCIAVLPKINDLANQFRNDVEVMWITNETPQKFMDGMKSRNLTPQSFAFPVASDPETRMMRAVGGSSWPHALVISSDWVVRWQGHPAGLSSGDLQRIVDANRAIAGNENIRYRWTGR